MHFRGVSLLLIAVFLASCIFESDENFKVVDPTVTIPPIQIDLELQDDTVDVFGTTFFQYDIKGFEPARNYIITFSTERSTTSPWLSEFKGQIQYDPDIDSGYVKATLRVETRSGTNSLADQLGLERIVFERSWILNVYTRIPKEPKITSIRKENGSLKVSWEKYDKINFLSYMVIRIKGSKYTVEKTITDPDSSFYFDRAYVGGEVIYSVVTNVKSGYSSGPFETYSDETASALVKYEQADNNKIKISWSTSPYTGNVGRYDIYESIFPNSMGDLIHTTTNPMDTTFTFFTRFGRPSYITVFTYSKVNNPEPEYVSSDSKEYVFGEKIEPYENIFFASTKNRYFTRDKNFLSAYSINSNELISKIEVPEYMNLFSVTKNENELIGVYENKLYSWNAATLQLNYQQDLASLLGPNQSVMGIGSTADNKVLLCKILNGSSNGSLIIYDPLVSIIEKEYTGLPAETILDLSPSGTYLMSQGSSGYTRILKLKPDNTLQSVYTTLSADKVFFNPSNEGQAIVGSRFSHPDGTVYIQDIETWQLIERISTPPLITYAMDAQSGYIAGWLDDGSGMLEVYDHKNQKVLFRAAQGSSPFITMHQGYLYSREGARIKFEE